MFEEEDELIDFDEADERDWRQYIREFKEKVFPMLEPHGFTLPQAIMWWRQEQVVSRLKAIEEQQNG